MLRKLVVVTVLFVLTLGSSAAATGGIPFGPNDLAPSLYGKPYTGSKILLVPRRAVRKLTEARTAGMHVIVKLAGKEENYQNPDGSFDLVKWEAAIDAFRAVPLGDFVADGTIVAHQIVSEAKAPNQWGGSYVIPNDVLDTMAAYSKSIWPTMPTLVRADAVDLEQDAAGYQVPWPGWTWAYLDAASSRYSARKGDPATFAATEQAAADRQGLALAIGMNVLSGGDGSSAFPSPEKKGAWAMSGDELRTYTAALLANSRGCSFEMWKYFSTTTYFTDPTIVAAMTDVAALAAAAPTYSCAAVR